MKSTYTTSKVTGLVVFLIGAAGWAIAVFSSPSGLQIDSVVIILGVALLYIFLELMWGTHVSVDDHFVVRTDNFFIKNKIAISDIDSVRYQASYGVGKEASSLYIFKKNQNSAVFTMTNLWFSETTLALFANHPRKKNPGINFDEEAKNLMQKIFQSRNENAL